MLATFLGNSGNIFFPKLNFYNDQIYFKDIALDFLRRNGLKPVIVNSEEEAKSFPINLKSGKYPIYFFITDTSGEKSYEEFFSEDEDYNLNMYNSLGFIKTNIESISAKQIIHDFDDVFNHQNYTKKDIIEVIKKYVPNFMHIETGKNLDQKM